jgi:hypothetical protein
MPQEGRFKSVSNALRNVAWTIDALPVAGLDDVTAAGVTAVAGIVDVAGKLVDGDLRGAGQEVLEGGAEALSTAIPLVEYGRFGKYVGLGDNLDVRSWARTGAGRFAETTFNAAAAGQKNPKLTALVAGNSKLAAGARPG